MTSREGLIWPKENLKTSEGAIPPGVRISPSPPQYKMGAVAPFYIVLSLDAMMRIHGFDKFVWNEFIRHFLVAHLSGHYAIHNVHKFTWSEFGRTDSTPYM